MQKGREQLAEVSLHAEAIGNSFKKTAFFLSQFITFMRKQKMTVQVLKVATKVLNDRVRKVIGKTNTRATCFTQFGMFFTRESLHCLK